MTINTKNSNQEYKPTTYGVTLGTWGTTHGEKTGYWNEIKALLGYGDLDTQHARITITIPNNKESQKLIEQYCKNPKIPYEIKKRVVKEAIKNKDEKWIAGDKVIFSEDAIVINFSWCTRRTEGEVPYSLPGYAGDSYIKGMELKMDWNSLKWSKADNRFVWKNKKVKTIHSKIHHLDRIIHHGMEDVMAKLEQFQHSKELSQENKEKIQLAIHELLKISKQIHSSDQKSADSILKSIDKLQSDFSAKLEATLGHKLFTDLKISKTPIIDLLKKHSKDSSAEEEMMLIGSGLAPSHEVRLPIRNIGSTAEHNPLGALDVESMFKTMHSIAKKGATEKKGWSVSRNCSETARRILFSGVTQATQDLEKAFKKDHFSITSPQKLLNWALRYQELITQRVQESVIKPVYELFKGRERSKAIVDHTTKNVNQPIQYEQKKNSFHPNIYIKSKNLFH